MDRYNPPSLIVPAVSSLISALFLILGYRMPDDSFFRVFFVAIGVILAGVAVFTGLDWLIPRAIDYLARMREAWYAPGLRFAEVIAAMNVRQLDLLEAGGIIRLRPGGKIEGRIHWQVALPEMDIPLSWIYEYLQLCEESFPDLAPQHGLSDNVERHRRQAFTKMVCNANWGIAEWASGNAAAHWLLPNMAAVYDALGMEG